MNQLKKLVLRIIQTEAAWVRRRWLQAQYIYHTLLPPLSPHWVLIPCSRFPCCDIWWRVAFIYILIVWIYIDSSQLYLSSYRKTSWTCAFIVLVVQWVLIILDRFAWYKRLIPPSIFNFVIWKMSHWLNFCWNSLSRVIFPEQLVKTTEPHLCIINPNHLSFSCS